MKEIKTFILEKKLMNLPLISVIIPTYNREQVLRETLAEVLQQTYPNFEVLVVDQTPTHEPHSSGSERDRSTGDEMFS